MQLNGKKGWVAIAAIGVSCLVYIITTLVAVNAAADKKWQTAQVSGFVALVFGSAAAAFFAVLMKMSA